MTWPAVLSWVLIAIFTLPRTPVPLVYLFFSLGAFSSLTLVPGESGVNVLPQALCAVFLVSKMVLTGGRMPRALDAAIDPAKLSLLFVFLAYALLTAYVIPRLFALMVEVVPLNPHSNWPAVLTPSSANFHQSTYLTLSVGVALAFFLEGESPYFRRHYMYAVLFGGLTLIATGLADMLVPPDLLEPFRNAKYSLLVNAEIAREKPIVGLTPEASAFGSSCVTVATILALIRPCIEKNWLRDWLAPLTLAGLLMMAVLSKSSTAYGGLGIFAAVYAANWLRRAFSPDAPARYGLKWEAIAAVVAMVALLGIVALRPDLMDPIYEKIDALIFKKSESSSFAERTRMTKTALHAFFMTYGLGVGLGSAMMSNWFVAILSNTGIFGAALLFGFMLRLYVLRCRSPEPKIAEFVIGLKLGLLPVFAMLAGLTPDMGEGVAGRLGLIASLTSPRGMSSLRSGVAAPQKRVRSRT